MWCRLDNSVRDNSIAFLSFELMAGRIALASVDFEPMAINKLYVHIVKALKMGMDPMRRSV